MVITFWQKNKLVSVVIIGAIMIGGFIYFGLKNKESQSISVVNLKNGKTFQNIGMNSKTSPAICGAAGNTIVTKVIDGDTVVVEGGYHVRLLGMDADEKGYPCYDAAKNRLESLILAKQVIMEKDKTDVDQYSRCLRYIFISDTNVEVELVKEGLVVARFYEPDVKYRSEITVAEQQAQTNKMGCKWSGLGQVK